MKTKQLILCSLFCAFNIVFAQLIIPAYPVQFSLCIVPVLLCGLTLLPKYAFFTQLAYLLLGAAGLPVLGKFSGGIGVLLGPTGGYALSYPVMAFICASLVKLLKTKNTFTYFLCQLPGMAVCYLFGTAWLAFVTKSGFYQAFLIGVVPFIVFDILKMLVCSLCAPAINKLKK